VSRLHCALPGMRPSTIDVGAGLVDPAALHAGDGDFVLADTAVLRLFPELRLATPLLEIPGGERSKTMACLERVLVAMARHGLDRQARLIAIGGGSIGDLGGLAAALYARGITAIMVPTTLLAMVDSSVGGKTAVNLAEGKNLVGQFWPAAQVLIDPRFLVTLPAAEFQSGLGELLKMAIGLSPELFELLESERTAVLARDPAILEQAIVQALHAKIAVVESDPREQLGPRRKLNLGHTLAHALEAHSDYTIRHGMAVARGLFFALDIAQERNRLSATDAERCRSLLSAYGFRARELPPPTELLPFIRRDKKVCGDDVQLVLPDGIGHCDTMPVELSRLF